MSWAYIHPLFLPQQEANLALNDAGFVFGATVSDLCRTFRHRLYRFPDHLARFHGGCRMLGIHLPVSDVEVEAIAQELISRNANSLDAKDELELVLLATPGPIGYYLGQPGGAGDGPPSFIMYTFPLPFARYRGMFREGARLVSVGAAECGGPGVAPAIKHRSRLHWWLAERRAKLVDPAAIGLLVDAAGNVLETASANVLAVQGRTVVSVSRDRVLSGISLRVVQELCAALSIRFEEKPLRLEELKQADEAWLASTPYCLSPVRRLDEREWPCRWPIYEKVLASWSASVGVDIRGQILGGAAP